MRALVLTFAVLASGCLVRRAPFEPAPVEGVHETRRTAYPDGTPRREYVLLVWPDGRSERDGPEREFHPDGTLAGERAYAHDLPSGLWRTWYPDGSPCSEVDFRTPGARESITQRFWHPNGRPAAEGPSVAGVRQGHWTFWDEQGQIEREGDYRDGRRDGPWTLYDPRGARRAEGRYENGARVGTWTLWDESGIPHVVEPSAVPPDAERPRSPRAQ